MPRFLKLNPKYVELLKTLFEPGEEDPDLRTAFQRWESGEIDLTDAQTRHVHSAIVQRAIPRARSLVASSSWSEPLRADAEERLQAWDTLARIFGASLPD
jgi:hypothetical protein